MTQALNLANLANNVNSSGQLAGSAVNGAVASATTATNATQLVTADFLVKESGGKLYFYYGATAIASLDSSGNFTALAAVNAAGTP